MKLILPYLICFFCGLILYIIYQLKKVHILKYISRWPWGVRLIKNEYFNTLFKREKGRIKDVNRAVKLAKLRNQAENLKMYVIEVTKGQYIVVTMREWNIVRKVYPKIKHIWPPRDAVFQTR